MSPETCVEVSALACVVFQARSSVDVSAPTLLIVGGLDTAVLDLNRRAQADLRCDHDLAIVPGATHLFEEPGTLDAAAALARDWFVRHLVPSHHPVS